MIRSRVPLRAQVAATRKPKPTGRLRLPFKGPPSLGTPGYPVKALRLRTFRARRQPLPAPEAAAIQVYVAVTLNRDGRLASASVSRVQNDRYALRQYEQRMRDIALAVVRQCTPIRGLPPELYNVERGWRQFTYVFDPRKP